MGKKKWIMGYFFMSANKQNINQLELDDDIFIYILLIYPIKNLSRY